MFEIEYYMKANGEEPVKDFLDGLPLSMQSKAISAIEILEEFGNELREPYTKYMGNGIFELRIRFAKDISRIFFFFVVSDKIILTNGFIKKMGKTPRKELEKAKRYKKDYEEMIR